MRNSVTAYYESVTIQKHIKGPDSCDIFTILTLFSIFSELVSELLYKDSVEWEILHNMYCTSKFVCGYVPY